MVRQSRRCRRARAEQVQSLLESTGGHGGVFQPKAVWSRRTRCRAGDTLESIAKQYDVPWQLLAKINGIPAADLVQPGQQLKVIHGPFSATVDLGKNQMTLLGRRPICGAVPDYDRSRTRRRPRGNGRSSRRWRAHRRARHGAASVYAVGPAAVDHVLVLKKDSPAGSEISITSGPTSPSTPTAAAPPAFHLAPRDADEVADILSVGSRVTIKR